MLFRSRANALMDRLRSMLDVLPGQDFAGLTVAQADDFAYVDPVDESVSQRQGIRVLFTDDSRVVFRLSGTGTEGATLRVYLERFAGPEEPHDRAPEDVLAPVIAAAEALAQIREHTGRDRPDVTT